MISGLLIVSVIYYVSSSISQNRKNMTDVALALARDLAKDQSVIGRVINGQWSFSPKKIAIRFVSVRTSVRKTKSFRYFSLSLSLFH